MHAVDLPPNKHCFSSMFIIIITFFVHFPLFVKKPTRPPQSHSSIALLCPRTILKRMARGKKIAFILLGVPIITALCMLTGLRRLSHLSPVMSSIPSLHVKARVSEYPGAPGTRRLEVPDERVAWSVEWEGYKPVQYTAPVVQQGPAWADPDIK